MNGIRGILFFRNFDGKMKLVKVNSGKDVKYEG